MQIDLVASDNRWPKRAHKIVQIQNAHMLQPRHLRQRVIVREQARFQNFGGVHETRISSKFDTVAGTFMHSQVHFARALKLVQNFQTATSALALGRFMRVGQSLQLIQNKSRDDERPADKPA